MKRRKFMKGLAAILGMAVMPSIVFGGQDPQSWTLIIEDIKELPEKLMIEVGNEKHGKVWSIDLEKDYKDGKIEIKIDPCKERDDATCILIEYKYTETKDWKCWRKIFIAVQNFREKNNYTFNIELLHKNSPFDMVHWFPKDMSYTYKLMNFGNSQNLGMK